MEAPEISIGAVADILVRLGAELFGYKGRVVRGVSADKEYLVDNPNRRCPDIRKARAELDFKPSVGLEDGLRRMMTWYAANQTAAGEGK